MKFFAQQTRSTPAARTLSHAYPAHAAAHTETQDEPSKSAEGKFARPLWCAFLMGVILAAVILAAEVNQILHG